MAITKNHYDDNNSIGQFFTPEYIAKFMVENIIKFLHVFKQKKKNFSVLEPSVGEGVFLKYLLQNNLSNITAYELDKQLKDKLLKKYPKVRIIFNNFLGSDAKEKFDIIIGNPPYLGQNYNALVFQEYVNHFPICKKYFVGNMDLFYFFIHLGIIKLNPGGLLSFITTNYWINKSKKTGIKLLKPQILQECFLLQYIDLSQLKLFKGAKGQHNCIFVLQKKTEQEKINRIDKPIEIIQVKKNTKKIVKDTKFNEIIFNELIKTTDSKFIIRYYSSLTNKDLSKDGSWNLLYPEEVKRIVNKIENKCKENGKPLLLKDFFLIRNGLIFIKDDIFILKQNQNLKVENGDFFLKIGEIYKKISMIEKQRLKKIYKSKAIKPYGYELDNFEGYAIYFNKLEYLLENQKDFFKKKYPVLISYLNQFKNELKEILINAKENPDNIYFPRRGSFIKKKESYKILKNKLFDLEPLYENSKKIFIKYISDKNIFGYSDKSYFATSDTYFLWPKIPEEKIDYLFILAYLNSLLVTFLFKAKGIFIKRSKTKLEDNLPIPNLNLFTSEEKRTKIILIKKLASIQMKLTSSKNNNNFKDVLKQLVKVNNIFVSDLNIQLSEVINAIENRNQIFIQNIIDSLFLQLFDITKEEIELLLKKYYNF
ncbi:MAG: Eco57I restriction-modification methylase domain-containing protein [Promethearchaeota archaeon]